MRIGVIGFGNLGKALVEGLLSQKIIQNNEIYVCAESEKSLLDARMYGVTSYSDINRVIENSDVVFFVVKSVVFYDLSTIINLDLLREKIVISFMAGISIDDIRYVLGNEIEILRAMPTLAISKGNGVIAYTETNNSAIVDGIFKKIGKVLVVNENDINKFTSFVACGLGYAAYILEASVEAGIKLGFSEKTARDLVTNVYNALEYQDFRGLCESVATKGGLTEKGIEYLIENNVNDILFRTYERSIGS